MATAARPPTTPPAIAPALGPLELPPGFAVGVLKVSSFSRPGSLRPPEGARFVAPPLPLRG